MVDIISVKGIEENLDNALKGKLNIEIKECTDSTNDDVKKLAQNGAKEGYVVVACSQTRGKGRLGRSFFSPENTGVYISLLLKPEIKLQEATLITTAAAVSVCEALDMMGVRDCAVKWVNDVYLNSKKICGILTEAGFGTNGDKPDYVILGAGLNMYEPSGGFPSEIADIAGAAFNCEKQDLRNRFIACFLNCFFSYYNHLAERTHISEYRRRCFVPGCDVDVICAGEVRRARALSIDENCGLEVQFETGEKAVLTSGEISIRLAD